MVEEDSHSEEWGSSIAKSGFENEEDIADKFRNWETDEESQMWLGIMGYDLEDIQAISVSNLPHSSKPDIQVNILTDTGAFEEYISIKRATSANYNQIDKRWVETYAELWDIPPKAQEGLKMFVGREGWRPDELQEHHSVNISKIKDERRLYFDELPTSHADAVRNFFEGNSTSIIKHILAGDEVVAGWILVTHIPDSDSTEWVIRRMNNAVRILGGDFSTTRQGNMKLGDITIQRKGGDNGRETAQKLQFKMKPLSLFPSM